MVYKSTYGTDKEKKQPPQLGGVHDIQQKLYAKNTTVKPYKRKGFSKNATNVAQSWDPVKETEKEIDLVEKKQVKKKPITLFAKLFILSGLFFAFSVMGAFLVFFYGQNEVSYDAVDLSVLGPNSVAGGEEVDFDITVANNNPVSMILTDVVINYPKGTITADGQNLPLDKDIKSIDEIRSGLSDTVKFSAILLGKEGETKDINIVFQYRVPDSDRIFFKERLYQIVVESAPVTISAQHEGNYQTGDEMTIVVDVQSNAAETISNLLLSIDYPFGFDFASSSAPGIDSETYLLDALDPGEKQSIILSGTIVGQDNEQRTFRYRLGSEDANRPGTIGVEFVSTQSVLALAKPPIDIAVMVNNNPGSVHVARTGQDLNFDINYVNTLLSKLIDVEFTANLVGLVYDTRDVSSTRGYYRSNNNTVNWSSSEIGQLAGIESGEKGVLQFDTQLLDFEEFAGMVTNPELVIDLVARATNFEQGGEEKKIQVQKRTRITLATDAFVDQSVLYSVGPLQNVGPTTPTVGEVTTYTVRWQIKNTTSGIQNTTLSAKLPPYVSFANQIAPSEENIQYDSRTRTVTWNAGDIEPGVGFSSPTKEAFFTIGFEPSLNQVNQSPVLIEDVSLQATDAFTGITITTDDSEHTTRLGEDPNFVSANARVQE